jgi:hypothetical protein
MNSILSRSNHLHLPDISSDSLCEIAMGWRDVGCWQFLDAVTLGFFNKQ